MNYDQIWAAGIYIREREIVCLVGQVDMPPAGTSITRVGQKPVPHTLNRDIVTIPPVSCLDKLPAIALSECADLLYSNVLRHRLNLQFVHIACFGGFISTDKSDRDVDNYQKYGVLTNVSSYPKDWHGLNLYKIVKNRLHRNSLSPAISVGTDVDAAALGEFLFDMRNLRGQEQVRYINERTLVCLSISRSINGGIIRRNEIWEGEKHPLMSIIRPPRFTINSGLDGTWTDLFEGTCQYHKDCIEGLIGVGAIEARTGLFFDDIPDDHPVWDIVAYYVAQLCICVVGLLTPSTIVLTGRSIKQMDVGNFSETIIQKIRGHFYFHLTDSIGRHQPSYPELLDKPEFIRLPRQPKRNNIEYPTGGVPGRHGALRLAASEAIIKRESNNV